MSLIIHTVDAQQEQPMQTEGPEAPDGAAGRSTDRVDPTQVTS